MGEPRRNFDVDDKLYDCEQIREQSVSFSQICCDSNPEQPPRYHFALKLSLLSIVLSTLTACGGGGGDAQQTESNPTPTPITPTCTANQYLENNSCKNKIVQTITGLQLVDLVLGQNVILTAKSNVDLSVVYKSQTPEICSVTGTQLKTLKVGTCIIEANQAGDGKTLAASPVSSSALVTAACTAPQILSEDKLSCIVPKPTEPTTPIDPKPTEPTIPTEPKPTEPSTPTCTATQYLDGKSCKNKASQSITGLALPTSFNVGQSHTLAAKSSANLAVMYSSKTVDICTVTGVNVKAIKAGTCTVEATQVGDSKTLAASPVSASQLVQPVCSDSQYLENNTCKDKVTQTITGLGLPEKFTVGQTHVLAAKSSANLALTYSTKTADICTVTGANVKAIKAGTCTVEANQAGDSKTLAAKAVSASELIQPVCSDSQYLENNTCKNKTAQTITGLALPNPFSVGQSYTLIAKSSANLTVNYSSKTPDICTVTGTNVKAIKTGTCIVEANQTGDSKTLAAIPVSSNVLVTAACIAPKILSEDKLSCVDPKPTEPSTPTCTAEQYLEGNSCKNKISQTIIGLTLPLDFKVGQSHTLVAKSSANLAVTYSSKTPDICSVTDTNVKAITAGMCTIEANQSGDNKTLATQAISSQQICADNQYVEYGVSCKNKTAQTITGLALPNPFNVGQSYTLIAKSTANMTVNYSSKTPDICTVTGTNVKAIKVGMCTIEANQAGDSKTLAAQEVTSQKVGYSQTIKVTALPKIFSVGQSHNLEAQSSAGLELTYTNNTPDVCRLLDGRVTALAAGSCIIDISQAGDATTSIAETVRVFTSVSSTRNVQVSMSSVATVDNETSFSLIKTIFDGVKSIVWTFGSTIVEIFDNFEQAITHIFTQTGETEVSVTLKGENGQVLGTQRMTVNVQSPPKPLVCEDYQIKENNQCIDVELPVTNPLTTTGITLCGLDYKSVLPSANNPNPNQPCNIESLGKMFGWGQDGEIQAGQQMSYTILEKYGEQCIKDNVTGLIWEQKTDDDGLRDKDWFYTWYNPNTKNNGGNAGVQNGGNCYGKASGYQCDTQGYIQALNQASYCGYSDWRMPTRSELQSIVDYGRYNPSINPIFVNTQNAAYWSELSAVGSNVWIVAFSDGFSDRYSKNEHYYIRAVR